MIFTDVFFETTNPHTPYTRLAKYDVLVSIIFHTVSYLLIIYIFSFLFNLKVNKQTYFKLTIFLIIVMILGYIGRLYRVKSNYNYLKSKYGSQEALYITNQLTYNGYYTYYFLG
jgi:hypothetical protein